MRAEGRCVSDERSRLYRFAAVVPAWILAAVFLLAGLAKVRAHDSFTLAIWQFNLTSWEVAVAVAAVLPWIEIALGIALLVCRLRRMALGAAFLLLAGFTGALVWAWSQGLGIDCGCFGGAGSGEGQGTLLGPILRNILLMGCSVVSLVAGRKDSLQAGEKP